MNASILLQAVSILEKGGVVAFPTETYYGLAVDPFNEKALKRLFTIKQRDPQKPILVLIHEINQLSSMADAIPERYQSLMKKYWPGPLTLIFPARNTISPLLTCGSGTVGIRISSHPIAQHLCKLWGKPLTATSANISGETPADSAKAVRSGLGNKVDFIVDGGKSPAGGSSTIVGLKKGNLRLIRPGKLDVSMIIPV